MAVQFKDYYETLGVPRTATADEIKKAFRKLARIHHPDVARNKVAGEVKFKEINEAYEVLGDAEKRQKYDQLGANWEHGAEFTPPPGQGAYRRRATHQEGESPFEFSGTGFSDFFEQFFAGSRQDPGSFRRTSPFADESTMAVRGADAEADILVRLEEALRGDKREITLRRTDQYGKAFKTDTYQVKIPAGVHEGQRIRLAGQGSPGRAGGPAGDLFLRVRLAKHPDFRVEGSDLHYAQRYGESYHQARHASRNRAASARPRDAKRRRQARRSFRDRHHRGSRVYYRRREKDVGATRREVEV
jgi:curved DNA-binding protein